MRHRSQVFCAVGLALLAPARAPAQEPPAQPESNVSAPGQPAAAHEVLVVTPCGACSTRVVNSPAAVSVIPAASIATAPDRSFGELLRLVPGAHAVRYSTRDWEVTFRQPTANLSNSQLALIDGRPLYLDFLGVILWDFVTTEPGDVEQIEAVRGPASAVWGANALTGVVNIVTKSPRNAPGSALTLTAGRLDREAGSTIGKGDGLAYGFSASLSRALTPTVAARVSAGYFDSDPLPRPVGRAPLVKHPLAPDGPTLGGGQFPADQPGVGSFANHGTSQPHADLRVDQQVGRGRISWSAGLAGSQGIVYTGVGPFALEEGSSLGYGRVAYTRGRFSLGAFANVFKAKAPNLLQLDANGQPVRLDVDTQSYDVSAGWSKPIGTRSILTIGGNARRNLFDITMAPGAKDRTEIGAYAQEEFFLGGDEGGGWRLTAGARVDKFGNLASAAVSPRLALIWKPGRSHSLRASWNRAFRAPSVINNHLEQYFLYPIEVPGLPAPYLLPARGMGNAQLKAESLTAWELGYIGTIGGHTTLGINVYRSQTRDNIDFMRLPNDFDPYTSAKPPGNWPFSPALIDQLAAAGVYLPRTASQFRNLGPIRYQGVEAFVEHQFAEGVNGYANYSWQPNPKPLPADDPYPVLEANIGPRNRVNAGVHWAQRRVLGNLSLSYAESAFWVDVLAPEFDGASPAFTMFNATIGLRWAEGRVVTLLRGTNLTNAEVHQHVFGDIQKRALWLEARFSF
jgi:outer membrane receptor protein involved in Fe transport